MPPSSRHLLFVFGVLAIALAVPARSAVAQGSQGFVVIHFGPSAGASTNVCRQVAASSGRARTLFRDPVAIKGHVALRFKASTTQRQVDSLIAATGIEAFPSINQARCRRYAFTAVGVQDDATTIARALQASGLVVYAAHDLSAGRSEGITRDSFFIDQVGLSALVTGGSAAGGGGGPPATYGMGQVLSGYTGPVMRVAVAEMSAQLSSVNSSTSALDLVRSQGLTTLRLDIPERSAAANVRVMLYSLNGAPVRQLVSEALEAGQYIVGWDGKDDRGRRVQPGVYVAVMTAGSFRETRRLVVR